jgi:hypothetical protein
MTFTMRLDLPGDDDRQALVCDVARRMNASGFTRAIVVVYTNRSFHGRPLPETHLV